jgi:hypothetical protein
MRRNLGLVEPSYNHRLYLYRQELQETYGSGKDLVVVSIGFYLWREDRPPDNGDNTFTFVACDGTMTTVAPTYGGVLALTGTRTNKAWCPL